MAMLTGLHILLTYRCTHACDHCFVYGSPRAQGTFTRVRIRNALAQAREVGTVEWIWFEGGEPFLYYPLLLAGLEEARACGFRTGVVTNAYWAESIEDAELWLTGLRERGVDQVTFSDDALHHGAEGETPAGRALQASRRLGLVASTISISTSAEADDVRYRGRAADRLVEGRPRTPADAFSECPDEDLADPGRVHLDAEGNVHLCQGVLLGNLWQAPLASLLAAYDPERHSIVASLLRGGPWALAREHGIPAESRWVSACHLCFETRRRLRAKYPEVLGPGQVYEEP